MLELAATIALGLVSAVAVGHILLHKRDPRAALGWIVACVAFPGLGAAAYWILGVNRIRTRGRRWRHRFQRQAAASAPAVPAVPGEFATLRRIADAVTLRPLVPHNRVTPLHDGEEAFPAMLAAVGAARRSVVLSTYIFESNATGMQFVDALAGAAERGADVKVLVDAVGERYSRPPITRLLRRRGVRAARFLPPALDVPPVHLNLRNHRKILVVDGAVGFTGGMNIGDRHLASRASNPRRVVDLHFRVEGPMVAQMEEVFLVDWAFTTGEDSAPAAPDGTAPAGSALCRGVAAGPNEDFEKLTWMILGALSAARETVRIMTPYFIPGRDMISALVAAALRGVRVEILLPGRNNLPFVDWACRAHLWELLEHGICVGFQPPPFVHTKIFLVDDHYALVGSANMDPRSLRLNFEYNLEVYDREFAAALSRDFDAAKSAARPYTIEDDRRRGLLVRLRDGAARLLSPYL